MEEKEKDKIPTWLIVLVVLLIIILTIVTLGQFGYSGSNSLPEAYKDSREDAKRKHKKLVELIEKQKLLQQRLFKRFKMIYFSIRCLLVAIFALLGYCAIKFNVVNDLSGLLNLIEVAIIGVAIANFLTFGSVRNYTDFIDLLKTRTENWIYGKYINLESRIESNKIDQKNWRKRLMQAKHKVYFNFMLLIEFQ